MAPCSWCLDLSFTTLVGGDHAYGNGLDTYIPASNRDCLSGTTWFFNGYCISKRDRKSQTKRRTAFAVVVGSEWGFFRGQLGSLRNSGCFIRV